MKAILIILMFATACLGVSPAIVNFNSGYVSEFIEPRSDYAKYASCSRLIENMFVETQGPVEKRPGTKYIVSSPNDVNVTGMVSAPVKFLVDVITSPYTAGGLNLSVWRLTGGNYTVYDTVDDPPYITTYAPHRSFDNYIYIGGGLQADGNARPTKIDSDFNAVAGWPAYDTWSNVGSAMVWDVVPTWDGVYVYVTEAVTGTTFHLLKLLASDGSLEWEKTTGLSNDWSIGVNENDEVFLPGYRVVPTFGEDTPAVFNPDGTLKKDYYQADGSAATAVGLQGVLSVGGKWYPYGNALVINTAHSCGIMQCFDDTERLWNCIPWGANGGGICTGAVHYNGYFYLSITTKSYDGGSKNCLKVDPSDGSIIASAYLGTATGRDIVKTPEGQLIFCTITKFIEIDEDLNVLNTYTNSGNVVQAEYTPDWWDYYEDNDLWSDVAGTVTVQNTKIRLIPFEFSTDDAYVLEFGNRYVNFLRNSIDVPELAKIISPLNSAIDVNITQDLNWTAGIGATSHDVYFGTVSPGTFIGNQTAVIYDTGTMDYNTVYYWRIDEKNQYGTATGDIWNFTTVPAAPGAATIPAPATGATNVGVTTDLSWTAGIGSPTSRDVYFGTSSPGTLQGNQTATTFDTGTMDTGTTYYWRIDEKNAGGTTTGTVWNFITTETLYENQTVSNTLSQLTGAVRRGQTFASSTTHTITSVSLRLSRYGQTSGTETFIIEVYAVDTAHKPTGAAKVSGTFTKDQLSTDSAGDWLNIPLTGSTPLITATIEYAIVMRAQNEGSSSYISWLRQSTNVYASGLFVYSDNSGSTWTTYTTVDYTFKEYGLE